MIELLACQSRAVNEDYRKLLKTKLLTVVRLESRAQVVHRDDDLFLTMLKLAPVAAQARVLVEPFASSRKKNKVKRGRDVSG